ncbi:serine hydrolase [Chryseobacterium sp. BIGb0232]|uniref:serine hydrolase domain-containing protein n=1 Tax=Chryseobacterium sp. BIGb0232 TaxID=2940598 RepID=UPI000F4A7F9C|nr:serine hydrolase domain-containing protein [Chryseobacterium sp. BIGb0232]MCS4302141.1 CubicO group peptidase (beta-lactamase class C family) [Chryseobacterium sp. BIGb0232]ROS18087.1 CubicO group peptidase (beta-lactamase class C family) [Chryseobacterium nakagawai]
MRKYFILFMTSLSLISCQTMKTNSHPVSYKTNDSLDLEINKIYQQGNFNGFSVSIVNDQSTLYQKGFGFSDIKEKKPYTINTIQNIASVSKTLVGIALLKAQELGKLNLDDPIQKYLPFKVINPKFPETSITIRQLATHTSSILDTEFYLSKSYFLKPNQNLSGAKLNFDDEQVFNTSDSIITMAAFLKNVLAENGKWNKNSFSLHKPGTIYEYSNVGTALAAFIIEQATGQEFSAFTKEYILNPLQMNDSGWKFEDIQFSKFSRLYESPKTVLPYYLSATYPDGGFITSINDLSKYLTELIKGYNGKGTILNQKSYKEYFTPQLSATNFKERNTQNPYSESYNVGIFMGFGYTGYIGHTGGDPGVMSMLFFDPKNNLGRIMIFNTNFSDKKGNDAFYGIWNVLEKYQSAFSK